VKLLNKIQDVKSCVKEFKKQGLTIGFAPTMGALHRGHESLIKKSKEMCAVTAVSIFVNPIQFCPGEDFEKYPRTLEKDLEICEKLGADIVFAPSAEEMYGKVLKLSNDNLTFICPPYNLTDCMCGKSRPGHFDGAATVVLKLFNIVSPDYAFFGQKDAQQLFIMRKMAADLNLDVKIIPCPIVREADGLALSSRNVYLSSEERQHALSVNKALFQIKNLYQKGFKSTDYLFDAALAVLDKNIELEYLEFRNFDTFEPVRELKKNTLAAIAVKSGAVRLIDNIIIE